jgi:hypothetical protein
VKYFTPQRTEPKSWTPKAVQWPASGTADFTVATAGKTAIAAAAPGGLPVRVAAPQVAAAARGSETPTKVTVNVKDRTTTARAGVTGLLLAVGRSDGAATAGKVSLTVDYSKFRGAYGGDWGARLRLVQLPDCSLATACGTGRVLPTTNDAAAGTLTATVDVPAAAKAKGLIAAVAGTAGSGGSFSATSLSPSGSWSAGSSSGDFTWSYPIELPPSLGGPSPSLALGYSSGSVDGKTAATNSQSSGLGDGWDMQTGFMERRYRPCSDDMAGGNNTEKTGDQCWASDNIVMSLNGRSTELVRDDATSDDNDTTKEAWRPASDDGSRIEHLTGASNGDNNGEHWRVTTTDGTQYYFGRQPRATESVWTVPVAGNHAKGGARKVDEPCHSATFAGSFCDQAWRWNLDYVVDTRGNSMTYFYVKEFNNYGRNNKPAAAKYVRGGYLDRIEYGQRAGAESTAAPSVVKLGYDERCLASASFACTDANFKDANQSHWPDVPVDQYCGASTCPNKPGPSFWTRKRLTSITTKVLKGTTYSDVDAWTLTCAVALAGFDQADRQVRRRDRHGPGHLRRRADAEPRRRGRGRARLHPQPGERDQHRDRRHNWHHVLRA